MSYRNKTYVAFASEDILHYRLMTAWRSNENMDFNFFNAHDLFIARDNSLPETIRGRLRERMKNAKQIVLLGTPTARYKGGNGSSFLAYEIKLAIEFDLPIVVANLNKKRTIDTSVIPQPLIDANHYTVSVSFQPAIIQYALDHYAPAYAASGKNGPHYYEPHIYSGLGI